MRSVNTKEAAVDRENRVKDYWNAENVFNRSMDEREGAETFVFYEGPPTANGLPHAGHVLGRVIKDFVARYKTMGGYQVLRKGGWDTHGLPVELEVEKQLGISGKQQIEEYGVEKFIEECKKSVFNYEKQWREFTESIGYWLDMDDPYVTLQNRYIESVWYILSDLHKRDLLSKGHRVTPYCPSCQTTLSSHEVAQGYEDVKDLSATAKFKVKGSENEFFLGWTTTPWTLPANVTLAVHPALTYVKAKQNGEVYIVAEALAEKNMGEDYEVLSTHKGSEFTGVEYDAPFPFVQPERGHFVVEADFVNAESGTGVVHIAPAYGEDDYALVNEHNLSFFNVVDSQGRYTEDIPPFAGRFVKDCDVDIVKYLANEGLLFHKEKYEHSYPHCWRCDSPLLYYAIESWFIKTTELKDQFLKNNQQVEWYPDHIKDGRFGNFLENMVDWNIGRNRFWGTPLPIWICDSCNHQYAPHSQADLQEKAIGDIGDVELHKPYVDRVQLKCDQCEGTMNRVPEVIDVWFDSGSMPFAQQHYPFENKEQFEKQFPADVICEGIDQTRGWFYSLLAVSTLFTGKAPYKRVLSTGHILDEEGRKMSKSKGNALDPMDLVNKFGADAFRWALLADSAPWNNKRFSERVVVEAKSKVIDTLVNTHGFYTLYANIDGYEFDAKEAGEKTLLDRWVLARLNSVTATVTEALDHYDFTKGAKELEKYVDELSNWYIRRSRDRFWQEGMTESKKAAYHTLHEVLVNLSKLLAPFIPFVADDIHHNLTGESVHLAYFPKVDDNQADNQLEQDMDAVLQVVELARGVRNTEAIKTKQPLSELVVIPVNPEQGKALERYNSIIRDEINVKEVVVKQSSDDLVRYEVKLNFRAAGPVLGKNVGAVKGYLEKLSDEEAAKVVNDGKVVVPTGDGEIEVPMDLLNVERVADSGLSMGSNQDFHVILDTTITEELRLEGLAREVIRVIQDDRKQQDLPIDLRVNIALDGDEDVKKAIQQNEALIRENVLVKNLTVGETDNMKDFTVGESQVRVALQK
ncbi:isoleucine--tRNA ligase [Halobacillus halophilus]|uniref:Isoleucine--tRNA ligase n=1 Tax=Halobacillus halophilus (strain ATCC 35676 / DSM 2266 / JCM 20832 / KCTC 3685 / LMG 17431 / NBRC 102448 / NCIMB 2269) TaxID=866895 RepID=I0JHJ5_HALH3|nr:isoleucine--tRNA ligase [Halobacillus halophilus]ASF37834.1 isoleucine--tRNA ligase [Halobacillus halophilus]CCG43613.1 isoleucyl-tRNA synthetase [Halobacillus halophilus DSM 2266]